MSAFPRLRRARAEELAARPRRPVDPESAAIAAAIVEDVRARGEPALREHAERWDGLAPGAPLVLDRDALARALARVDAGERALLERVAARVRRFAEAQRAGLAPLELGVEGGRAGARWLPVAVAGAYVPGGRYPLPSSALMTVVPARVAGVDSVWVASPRPAPITLAAAAVAGADGLVAAGGAQAVAALAFGTVTPPADVVVGPGNRFVTAAKRHLAGEVGLDGLAGPSELVVIAGDDADPSLVAADLLAQAEHDPDAVPILVTPSAALLEAVDAELARQASNLATRATAAASVARGGLAVVAEDWRAAVALADRIAPEHLELCGERAARLAGEVRCYGSLFVGSASAAVFGDYGAGPNHVLPTGGSARFQGGLSVASFLRAATWLALDDPAALLDDVAALARLEGLAAHERAARARERGSSTGRP